MAAWAGLLLLQVAFAPLTTGLKSRPPPEWHIANRCADCTTETRHTNDVMLHDDAEWETIAKTLRTEWETFAKTLREPTVVKSSGEKMCLLGAAVPEFYLLGSQKSGTTTFSADALSLGFKSAKATQKELRTFNSHCNWHEEHERSKEEWRSNGAPSGACMKMTASDKERWAKQFARCESSPTTSLADFSPSNMRLPGLPELMADLYGERKSTLTFAILLREPLSRFQSGFYNMKMYTKGYTATFKEHVDTVLSMAPDMDGQSIGHDYYLDQFWRSMYSKSMKPWLDTFKPEQFVVIPSGLYFKNSTFRSSLFRHIGRKMGMEVNTTVMETQPLRHLNYIPHPSSSQDLHSSQIDALRTRYYDPANSELFQTLAAAIPEGLTLYGFEGKPTSSEIGAFLASSW